MNAAAAADAQLRMLTIAHVHGYNCGLQQRELMRIARARTATEYGGTFDGGRGFRCFGVFARLFARLFRGLFVVICLAAFWATAQQCQWLRTLVSFWRRRRLRRQQLKRLASLLRIGV